MTLAELEHLMRVEAAGLRIGYRYPDWLDHEHVVSDICIQGGDWTIVVNSGGTLDAKTLPLSDFKVTTDIDSLITSLNVFKALQQP